MNFLNLAKFCVFILLFPSIVIANSEMNKDELLSKVRQDSDKIKEFRSLLNDPDYAVRSTAIYEMINSEIPSMQELAYGICFTSAEDSLRATCLQNKMSKLDRIYMKIGKIENPVKGQEEIVSDAGGVFFWDIKKYNRNTNQFRLEKGSAPGKGLVGESGTGVVNGTSVEFDHHKCHGSFSLGDGAELEGKISCNAGRVYPGKIILN